MFFIYDWLLGLSSGSGCFGDSDGVLGLSAEEQGNEESEKRRKKKKGTKRKRDGRGQEEGTWACDLKLDDVLDRTLEDGAKQHNLTAVNVRNILHVSKERDGNASWRARETLREFLVLSMGIGDFVRCVRQKTFSLPTRFLIALSTH